MNWLRKVLFQVQFNYPSPLDAQRARGVLLLCNTLAAAALFMTLYSLTSFRLVGVSLLELIVFIAVLVMSIVIIALTHRGQLSTGAPLLVGMMLCAGTLIILPFGLNQVGILVMTIPLLLSGVLLTRRGVLLTLLMVVITLVGVTLLISAGLIVPIVLSANTALGARNILIYGLVGLIIDAGILWVFTGSQNNLISRTTRALSDLRATTGISQTMNSQFNIEDLLSQTVNSIRDQYGYYYVQIFLRESTSPLLVRRARTGGTLQARDERRIAPDDAQNAVADVFRGGQTSRITMASPGVSRTEFLPATQSAVLLPLRRGEQVLGVLDVQSTQHDAFTPYDIDVLEAVASQLAVALQNIQRYSELQTISTERQRLQEQVLRLARDVERLGQEAAGRTWVRYLKGRSHNVLGFDWKEGQTTPNEALSPAQIQALGSAAPEVYTDGAEQVLSVPIQSRGQTIGLMEFRAAPDKPWNNRSIELARILAQRLALSLDNVRLFEQSQQTANREQLINQVTARLQAKTELDGLLNTAAESFSQALGATRTNIQLALPETPAQQERHA